MDNVSGTAGNDTIKATAADFQALDVVAAGEGTDTLSIVDTAAFTTFGGASLTGFETLSISAGGIGALKVDATGSSSTQAAQAQVVTLTPLSTGTFASTDTLTVTIGNAVYTTTVGAAIR